MRLLFIGHTYMLRANRGVLYELADCGHQVIVAAPRTWPDPLFDVEFEPEQARLEAISLAAAFVGREGWCVMRGLADVLRRAEPDVIRVDHGPGTLICWQAVRLRSRLCPRTRLVFFTWWNVAWRLRPPQSMAERAVLAEADAAICGNSAAVDLLRDRGFDRPTAVIPQLGVDMDAFRPSDRNQARERLGLNFDGPLIGFVGRLVFEKGVLDLLHAFARLPEKCALLFVGRGEAEGEIRKEAARLNVGGRIFIRPSVLHAEVASLLPALDALVLASRPAPGWQEQFGHVIVEAMSCGVPVIGSDSGEIPNVVGDAGLVVPHSNPAALADALERILYDPESSDRLARAGRNRVEERFSNAAVARANVDFLSKIVRGAT